MRDAGRTTVDLANCLVVIRNGAQARTTAACGDRQTPKQWRTVLLPFEPTSQDWTAGADRTQYIPGGKWDGIARFFNENPDELEGIDVVWFPDDDLEFSAADVVALFQAMHEHGLALAQPALARGSEFSHLITLSCPLTRVRFTNFVELMMPAMSAELFTRILPVLQDYPAAKGLDYCWHAFDPALGARRIAILDHIQVGHHRALNVELMGRLSKSGVDVRQQRQTVLRTYPHLAERPLVTASQPRWPTLARMLATLLVHPNWVRIRNREKVKSGIRDQLTFDIWKRRPVPIECRPERLLADPPAPKGGD